MDYRSGFNARGSVGMHGSSTALKLENYDIEETSAEQSPKVERVTNTFTGRLIKQAAVESLATFDDRRRRTMVPKLDEEDASSAVVFSPTKQSNSRIASFTPLQEWDGYVLAIGEDSFTARLTDITTGGATDGEEAEIPFEELADSSIAKLEEGSLFRWSIGYERSLDGQKTRISRIILRQLPRWRRSELNRAEIEA